MIITRAPVRISFAGGGTDMPHFYENFGGGAVVSSAINKYFYTFYKEREDRKIQLVSSDFQATYNVDDFYSLNFGEGFDIPTAVLKHYRIFNGFELFMACEVPPGTGLGSSGAVAVNMALLCSTLKGKKMTKKEIAEDAYLVQRNVLNLPIGKQDEYASSFGGLNFIEFYKEKVITSPVAISSEMLWRLQRNLILFYTGSTRAATTILSEQEESTKKGEKKVIVAMENLREHARITKELLENGKLDEFGKLLDTMWNYKKEMNPNISNEFIESVYKKALKEGAFGGKLSGAGGGGFIFFYCPPERQEKLTKVLEGMNVKRVFFNFDSEGAKIIHKS